MSVPGPQAPEPPPAILALPQFPQRAARPSLEVFLNSLGAFMLRELKNRFGQFRLGYLWAVIEPASQVIVFIALHAFVSGLEAKLYGDDPAYFFIIGVTCFLMFQHGIDRSLHSISSNRGLFNYRQIRPIDIVLVRSILEFMIFGLVMLLFLAVGGWYGMRFRFEDPLAFLGLMGVLLVLSFGLGLAGEVAVTLYPDARRFISLLMRPMLFISGVFFTIEAVTPALRPWLLWNPVLHGIDLMRDAAMTGYDSPGSLLYFTLAATVSLFVGLTVYKTFQHRLL